VVTYADFAGALRDALRDFHSADLLARNPLLHGGIGNLGSSAGPLDLKALLSETVSTLFGNPRDEKLRRVIELTYFQPAPKQEAVADRLALSFGTYRRYLTTARERLARWLWESSQLAPVRPELLPAMEPMASGDKPASDPASPRLSVVVLPFLNISGDTRDDPFVDGITETLTTDLSRCSGVFAMSRNTAFAYKGKPIDTRQIGRELGVRYVLEGSVQNTGERMRFNAQLVDTESGAHLWADRFDKPRADLLDMQDEVTARLARGIHIELIAAESRRAVREHPDHFDSVDHTLHGWAAWNQHLSLEAARKARDFFDAALRLDEHNVGALLGFAKAHVWEVNMYTSDDRAGQNRAAEVAVTKALALAPDSADAHLTYGMVLFAMRAPERALREFEFSVSLEASLATAHAYLGLMKVFLGRARETRAHVAEAMRLSPRDPLLFLWHFFIGVADIHLGRMAHALESLRKSVEINPKWGLSQFVLAGALGLAGLLAEAAEVCAVAQRLAPNFTIAKFRAEAVSDNLVYRAQREHFCEGLRLAGAPEG
jgi:TolB-like protein